MTTERKGLPHSRPPVQVKEEPSTIITPHPKWSGIKFCNNPALYYKMLDEKAKKEEK